MKESFAIVLSENMKKLDERFRKLKSPYLLSPMPDPARFRAGRALLISQDGHNRVFAVVGCLDNTSLQGHELFFAAVQRFTIPVVLTNAHGQSSRLVLGKGYVNEFMYLAPEAEERVLEEAENLCGRQPIS